MVIYDSGSRSSELYEIKHSSVRNARQYRYLMNHEMTDAVEAVYGKIVPYRGENVTLDNRIEYRNVEEYLKNLSL